MGLVKLDVSNVRNIESARLEPSPRLNFILGSNGSGKTSLLEAIHILGRARSFRSNQSGRVIRFQQNDLTVSGRLLAGEGMQEVPIGVRLSRRVRDIVLAGQKLTSSADLIRAFPVLLIQPTGNVLLDDAPKYRRQFLDWGAFHLDEAYLEQWRGYVRALSQRNALLRSCSSARTIEPWNHELSRYGTVVAQARLAYASRLSPFFHEAASRFLGALELKLQVTPGWNEEKDLAQVLKEDLQGDLRDGFTRSGPHRGDFTLSAEGRPARNYLSRGQIKLLVLALYLAQARLMEDSLNSKVCVLIDDLASELDNDNREKLLRFLQGTKAQIFITATDPRLVENSIANEALFFTLKSGKLLTWR